MLDHPNSPTADQPLDVEPLAGLLHTHWKLALCPACRHERVHGERHHATCPSCGTALYSFALYRDLTAAGTKGGRS